MTSGRQIDYHDSYNHPQTSRSRKDGKQKIRERHYRNQSQFRQESFENGEANDSAFSFNKSQNDLMSRYKAEGKQIDQLNNHGLIPARLMVNSPKQISHMRSQSKQDYQFKLFNAERDRLSVSNRNLNNSNISDISLSIQNMKNNKLNIQEDESQHSNSRFAVDKMQKSSSRGGNGDLSSSLKMTKSHLNIQKLNKHNRAANFSNEQLENIQKLMSMPSDNWLMSLKIAQMGAEAAGLLSTTTVEHRKEKALQ